MSENNLNPATVITLSTLRLECKNALGISTGTGFLFAFNFSDLGNDKQAVAIITNKHVVEGAFELKTTITLMPKDNLKAMNDSCRVPNAEHKPVIISNPISRIAYHPNPDVDLCAIMISDLLSDIWSAHATRHTILGENWFLNEEQRSFLRAIEPIVMIGYPNGLWDEANNLPLVRSGLTGSHALLDWNNQKQFVVDSACFPGSSGSPVFLFQDGMFRNGSSYSPGTMCALLGVPWGGPMFKVEGRIEQRPIPTGIADIPIMNTMMNLGYVVKADEILVLKNIVVKLTQS